MAAEPVAKRLQSEERVLEAVREILPELQHPQDEIHIRLVDPDRDPEAPEDSTFTIVRLPPGATFACRRGS